MASLTAWLTTTGASLLLGFIANLLTTAIKAWQDKQAAAEQALAKSAADQAKGRIDEAGALPADDDDAISDMEKGRA